MWKQSNHRQMASEVHKVQEGGRASGDCRESAGHVPLTFEGIYDLNAQALRAEGPRVVPALLPICKTHAKRSSFDFCTSHKLNNSDSQVFTPAAKRLWVGLQRCQHHSFSFNQVPPSDGW